MDEMIRVLLLKDGRIIVTKLEEVIEHEIGEPDCVMIDPVLFDESNSDLEKALTRFPGKHVTPDTKMAILSDNILTMVTPDTKLLAEYLVAISD
jgi:hypothetical protein